MNEIFIGRQEKGNDIVIDDNVLSRQHCKCIMGDDGVIKICDLDSKNGVFVDKKRITEATEIKPTSVVKIGSKLYTYDNVKKWFAEAKAKNSILPNINDLRQKYMQLSKFYSDKTDEMKKAVLANENPYKLVFATEESKLDYYINEYNRVFESFERLLSEISDATIKNSKEYYDDMDNIQQLVQNSKGGDREYIKDIRIVVDEVWSGLQKSVLGDIKKIYSDFDANYGKIFDEFYESCDENKPLWNKIVVKHDIPLSNINYGKENITKPLFKDSITVTKRCFVKFLNNNNLVLRYNNNTSKTACKLVNSLISRILVSSRQGNVGVHMIDCNDLDGTSNLFKLLNRKIFMIQSRADVVRNELSMLSLHIENVVHNLLQGSYTSLAEYNEGKENQEPYHMVVIKDFPFGFISESAHYLHKILSNGTRSGVQVVIMLNEDMVGNNEEAQKMVDLVGFESAEKDKCVELSLVDHVPANIEYDYNGLSDEQIQAVIKYVNAGFEVKKETVLRLLDYMIPRTEWWSGKSASRIDVPFGISSDMQTQSLHITQESGQNSAVVIGIPGSGKSVFLHALIANSVVHYSPKELQLYLLDFSGVEFNIYAQHKLPHARVIAPEAEREFGLSILKELKEEGTRRMTLCRENDVTNIVELKEKNPDIVLPRLLVIIDEFQKIFEIDNDKISQEANRYIHIIIQEYRKFGINLILATQKLPSKSILPRDLIANRVVFKSDPNDYSELIKWPSQTPKPQLGTGVCVYNDESGSEYANNVTKGFFIKTSTDLNTLLDDVTAFAGENPEKVDDTITLRVFRSDDLPDFKTKVMADKHYQLADVPREVGVYVGENIAIASTDVYVPLVKESSNNILIIGGRKDIANKIGYYALLSEASAHNENTAAFCVYNFMRDSDDLKYLFESEAFEAIKMTQQVHDAKTNKEVIEYLNVMKEVVDNRKDITDESEMRHVYLHFVDFQFARLFDMEGGDRQSEASKLLEYILNYGPSVGVFTILQVENLTSLNRIGRHIIKSFNHRIVMQMSEDDSNKVVGSAAANKLKIMGRPSTEYRALYFDVVNNNMTKFKPYK